MSDLIPFDSSLALASVVCPEKLDAIKKISKRKSIITNAEARREAAQTTLRSLDMLLLDVITLSNSITEPLRIRRMDAVEDVNKATSELIDARMSNIEAINEIKSTLRSLGPV